MNRDSAEVIALNGLTFIAENEKYLASYLNLSGIDLTLLKDNISNPETMPHILASIFDFLLQNEKILIEFSQAHNVEPMDIDKGRHCFPGAIDHS